MSRNGRAAGEAGGEDNPAVLDSLAAVGRQFGKKGF